MVEEKIEREGDVGAPLIPSIGNNMPDPVVYR